MPATRHATAVRDRPGACRNEAGHAQGRVQGGSGRQLPPAHAWSSADVLRLQRQAGNAAATALLVQRVRDYGTAVPRGSGLTPDADGPHGRWHIHLIRDGEGLGLVEQAFIRLVDRPQGSQHIMLDRDGTVAADVGLYRTGPQEARDWALKQLRDFLGAHCPEVDVTEVERRRKAKAEEEQRKQEAMAKLAPAKVAGQHDYASGKQAGLFGSRSVAAVDDETAKQLLAKAGLSPSDKDYKLVRTQLGKAKDQWNKFAQPYYDKIYPPVLETVSTAVAEHEPKKDEGATTKGGVEEATVTAPTKSTATPELQPSTVRATVAREVQQGSSRTVTTTALLAIGVPLALIVLIFAILGGGAFS